MFGRLGGLLEDAALLILLLGPALLLLPLALALSLVQALSLVPALLLGQIDLMWGWSQCLPQNLSVRGRM